MATRKRQAQTSPKEDQTTFKVAGVSAAAARDFLLQSAELPRWPGSYLQKTLAIDAETTRGVLSALSMAGYIEPDPDSPKNWRNTAAGNMMAKVSRARPVTRKTAEKNLADFLGRVNAVNLESDYLYAVQKAVLFGPYLTSGENVKNVDIAIELKPKITDARKLEERVKADSDRAESGGKQFKSFADKREWGENKVRQQLKGRSRVISLYDLNDSILGQAHRVVYER